MKAIVPYLLCAVLAGLWPQVGLTQRGIDQRPGDLRAEAGWHRLAIREVGFRTTREIIGMGAAQGRFRSLRLRVTGNDIYVEGLKIVYADGERQQLVGGHIWRGNQKTYDLAGNARAIERIEIEYAANKRYRGRGPASIQFWGERVLDWPPRAGDAIAKLDRFGPGWQLLATQTVTSRLKTDQIRVGDRQGAFTALRLHAVEHDIVLRELGVTYGNGERRGLIVDDRLRAGRSTGWVGLPGGAKRIREINLTFRTLARGAGRGSVEIWAKRADPTAGGRPYLAPRARYGPDWLLLGTERVGARRERDVIHVDQRPGPYAGLRLHATGGPVDVRRVLVTFADGQRAEVAFDGAIDANASTRRIVLPRTGQAIDTIEITHRARTSADGAALVEFWGERAARVAMQPQPPPIIERNRQQRPPFSNRWEVLGRKVVNSNIDRAVIPVGRDIGRFRKLRLKVRNHDIFLMDVNVHYGNGHIDAWPINRRVRDEEQGVDFDLTGGRRVIDRVVVRYRATNPFEMFGVGGKSEVQILGGR